MAAKTSDWRPGPAVCRCCLAEGCYKDISTEYFWMGKREVYSEMLSDTFDITISYSKSSGPNSNSRLICEPCISRLRDASEFKKQVQDCEKTFMQHLDPGSANVSFDLEPLSKEVKLEQVKQEARVSDDDFDNRDLDDDDDDELDNQPLTKLATKVPKKESVDLLDLLDNAKVAEKRKATTKTKAPPPKKTKVKPSSSKPVPKPAPKPEKKKKDVGGERRPDATKQNAILLLRHSTAYPIKNPVKLLRCCFCLKSFDDPSEFRAHMDTEHEDVDRSVAIKKHRITRVDITGLRCKSCLNRFSSLELLIEHLNNEHSLSIQGGFGLVPMKLAKDNFECIICSKRFTSITTLSRHSGAHFGRYVCDVCGKSFETRCAIDDHILYHHSAAKFHCRVCKIPFQTLNEKRAHVRMNKKCLPFRCCICMERFISWECREDHLVQVHNKPKRVYPCTECDKVFIRRPLLYTHFKSTHTDDHKCHYCNMRFPTQYILQEHIYQHTGERPFKCTVCDKSFYRKKALQQHNIIHDDSRKAVCSVCSRLFNGRSKLKAHVKRRHPEVYIKEFS